MSKIIRHLIPVYIAEFVFVFMQWMLLGDSGNVSDKDHLVFLLVSLVLLPFFAGFIAARFCATKYLGRCALAGASVSIASVFAIALKFSFMGSNQFFLAMLGYLLVTILMLLPKSLAGLLGGWYFRNHHAHSST